ncbi:MAG: EAL domain-containing protein [Dokdonella sp.]|uniref:putative bifunctional diguanylate cyclase/phosphodiesterase n=1 Tax=Dokdonella sp. TaxID=2291710 RepID=UPI0032642A72
MNNTLKYLSIQHELGMAVGTTLRLQPMLATFSRIVLRRLGLSSVHFHMRKTLDGEHAQHGVNRLDHVLSVPRNAAPISLPQGILVDDGSDDCVHYRCADRENSPHCYSFRLGALGVMTLQRIGNPLDPPIIELLKPLITRLALGCQASIEHENLLLAVAARRKAEETILFQLLHDDLTRLPNRRLLMQRLDAELLRARDQHRCGALLFLDLDRFKMVNDTLGHAIGDLLLVAVADKLQQILGADGMVARLSGDEFVMLMGDLVRDERQVRSRVDVLLAAIRAEFSDALHAGEHRLHVTPSIGIEIFPDRDCSAEQILRRADTAMYQAKLSGPNGSMYYNSQLSAGIELRRQLEKELQLALKAPDQFELYYQSQHNLAGDFIGAEALIRWHSPYRDAPSPTIFIPLAEETGLMLELGRLVIRRACADIRRLFAHDPPAHFRRVSINVSAVQFNHPDFVQCLFADIDEAGIDSYRLALELTESTLIRNHESASTKMAQLRGRGVKIAIDDFGTGYSSLAYLSRLPVESIKIDQSFVHDLDSNGGNRAIVGTIIALGRALDIDLVAEGVETEAELASLEALGCRNYQGLLFSRPQPLDCLIAQLRRPLPTA